jgi:hypothetical protein
MLSGKWCAILLSKHRNHLQIWTIQGRFLLLVTSLLACSALAQSELACIARGLAGSLGDVVLKCTSGTATPIAGLTSAIPAL